VERYNASGVTALQLVDYAHNVSYRGRLECIDSICDTGKYYWQFYVNGKPSMLGVADYKVQPGDKLQLTFGY